VTAEPYSPTHHLPRAVTEDTTVRGVQLRSVDRIVLDRFPNKHVSFGLGAHRCVGINATFTPGTKLFPHQRLPGMDGD
jgi:cytochrome P450